MTTQPNASVVSFVQCLERLSLPALDRAILEAVRNEKRFTALVVLHLSEVARRKAHVDLGYSSLFAYCRDHLGLSEGSIPARLQVANVCREIPELLYALAYGRVSLTVASLLAPHIEADNAAELIEAAAGLTRRQCEEFLVRFAPKELVSSSVRRKPRRRPAPTEATECFEENARAPANPEPNGRVEPAQVDLYNLRFSATSQFKNKLERLAEVLGIVNPEKCLAEVLEKALDVALEKKAPERRAARRRRREKAKNSKPRKEPRDAETNPTAETKSSRSSPSKSANVLSDGPPSSRHIPAALRDEVLEEANYQCEYVSASGRRCSQRCGLEIDHRKPYAMRGSSDRENLRALCRAHNLRAADRAFGESFMRERISSGREKRFEESTG